MKVLTIAMLLHVVLFTISSVFVEIYQFITNMRISYSQKFMHVYQYNNMQKSQFLASSNPVFVGF